MREGEAAEVDDVVRGQVETRCLTGHGARSWCGETGAEGDPHKHRGREPSGQALKRTRAFMLTSRSCETQH